MNRIAITLLAVLSLVGLAGCNTIQGLGKDISKAGDKIEETARRSK